MVESRGAEDQVVAGLQGRPFLEISLDDLHPWKGRQLPGRSLDPFAQGLQAGDGVTPLGKIHGGFPQAAAYLKDGAILGDAGKLDDGIDEGGRIAGKGTLDGFGWSRGDGLFGHLAI